MLKQSLCHIARKGVRLLAAAIIAYPLAAVSQPADNRQQSALPERLLVRLNTADGAPSDRVDRARDVTAAARFSAIAEGLQIPGLSVEQDLSGILVIKLPAGMSEEQRQRVLTRLAEHSAVEYVEPDIRVRPYFVPNDPQYLSDQWFLWDTYGIDAPTAWDSERGEASVVVALLDTGILTHEDLDAGRILPGYDFITETIYSNDGDGRDADPSDPGDWVAANECGAGEAAEDSSWHGLHLTGLVAATTDNVRGVAGINHVSRILPVRVLGKCGGSFSDIIAAMQWAAGLPVSGVPANPNPARIINLSFGGQQSCTAAVQDAINQVVAAGSIVVVAAGNDDGADVSTIIPAGCNHVITVAGSTRGGVLGSYSNQGSRVLISAPGGNAPNPIRSIYNAGLTVPTGDAYADIQGTSAASAITSGVVSLMLSIQPALTLDDVMFVLQQTATPFPAGGCASNGCGSGIVDAAAAVQLASTTTPGSHTGYANTFFNISPTPAPSGGGEGGGGGGGGGCVMAAGRMDAGLLLLLLGLAVFRGVTRWSVR